MLDPKMTPMACRRAMMPLLTKPTTMTVVALELWMTAVTAKPSKSPMKRLLVRVLRIFCNLPPACCSRAFPMRSMPNRNRARPPNK